MKKLLALRLTAIVCLCCLASCGSAHKENTWFSEEKLTECFVGDLPTVEKDYINHNGEDIYVSFTDDEFEAYAKSVYDYLLSQKYKYLGTRGEQASTLAGSFTTYYFKTATDLSEFYVDSSYKFVYSDGTLDEGGDPIFCILTIYDYEATNLEYGTKNFAYNTLITLRYKQEAPLSGRCALNEEEKCDHQWNDGVEVEGANGGFVMEYTCTLCGVKQRETMDFLDGIKASISADAKETSTSSSKVVESLDVKTTKSILLRRVIDQCASVANLDESAEGDLIKIDRVKLELLDEESLRQFLILRRDALKGMRVEGMEVNNLVSSMLQDYAYILKGIVYDEKGKKPVAEIIIKIPMEIQSEFENKYNINDLLIGHVSIVGIYKGIVSEEFITSNTFTYFQEAGARKEKQEASANKVIKSNTQPMPYDVEIQKSDDEYHFVDTLAIIQDVAFKLEATPAPKIHWWNRFGIWLSKLWRK